MGRISQLTCLLLPLWRVVAQPPAIAQNGVVNQASHIAPTLPGGALARGALIDIRGVRLAVPGNKTAVMLAHDNARVLLPVLSATERRIEASLPMDAPLGDAMLVVSVKGNTSQPFPVQVVTSNPGVYSNNGQGWGPGVIGNLTARGKRSENSRSNPAKPGQRISLAATGLAVGAAARVSVGGRWTLAAVKPADPGKEELLFNVPSDTPPGCNVPLYVLAAPKRASNVVTVAVSQMGPCTDPFISGFTPGRLGLAVFSRTVMQSAAERQPDSVYDEAVISFAKVGVDVRASPLMLMPPPGTCIAYSGTFQIATMLPDSASAALVSELGGTGLDAGPVLSVSRDGANRTIPGNPSAPGFFRARLGGQAVLFGPRALDPFLDPGEYRWKVPGGRDVGAFQIAFAGPSPVEWINRNQTGRIDRGRELRLEWRGAARDQQVIILATNVDQMSTATGTVLCLASSGANQLTMPPEILANLPPSTNAADTTYNRLLVGTLPAKIQHLHAPGLDDGAVIGLYTSGRYVQYR